MLRVLVFIIFVAAVILILGLVELLLLRWLNRVWWERKWIRRAAWSLPFLGVAFLILLVFGEYYDLKWLAITSAALCALAVILEICLMFSLPVSGLIHLVNNLIDHLGRHRERAELSPLGQSRRLFLRGTAAVVPLATLGSGLSGIARAFGGVNVYRLEMQFPNLPAGLERLRILHLTDGHIRQYVTLDDLEQVLADAEELSPDLIFFTGDIADDLSQLPDVLNMIADRKPRLGAFATLGNHEHFRGLETVHAAFGDSGVSLLVNEQVRLPLGTGSLLVAGIDDPVNMRYVRPEFFRDAIDESLQGRQPDNFTILLSHRPDAFSHASQCGVDLTLAGHTHGGQLGLWGRSLLESYYPEKYLWGRYRIGNSQLYTSCGVGHWFPWRLGCPPEAPVIELRRGSDTPDAAA